MCAAEIALSGAELSGFLVRDCRGNVVHGCQFNHACFGDIYIESNRSRNALQSSGSVAVLCVSKHRDTGDVYITQTKKLYPNNSPAASTMRWSRPATASTATETDESSLKEVLLGADLVLALALMYHEHNVASGTASACLLYPCPQSAHQGSDGCLVRPVHFLEIVATRWS